VNSLRRRKAAKAVQKADDKLMLSDVSPNEVISWRWISIISRRIGDDLIQYSLFVRRIMHFSISSSKMVVEKFHIDMKITEYGRIILPCP
jgi:hypothetical protein